MKQPRTKLLRCRLTRTRLPNFAPSFGWLFCRSATLYPLKRVIGVDGKWPFLCQQFIERNFPGISLQEPIELTVFSGEGPLPEDEVEVTLTRPDIGEPVIRTENAGNYHYDYSPDDRPYTRDEWMPTSELRKLIRRLRRVLPERFYLRARNCK